MYSEEELEKLENEEHALTEEALVAMFAILRSAQAGLEKELRAFYQQYGKDGVVTYQEARKYISKKKRQRRLFWLFTLLTQTFSDLGGKLYTKFDTLVQGVIAKESAFFNVEIEKPKVKWGADDLAWSDRLANDIDQWSYNVAGDIKRGMLRRDNIDDVLDMIDGRFTTMKRVLRALGITETTAIGAIARKEIFKELRIKKYRFYTQADERTCEVCGAMHGLIFPLSSYEPGVTASPMHPRCRCFEIPIAD